MNECRLTFLPFEDCRNSNQTLIYYPGQWGGNAHPGNRAWCAVYPDGECDYGTIEYLIEDAKKESRLYIIVHRKRKKS